MQKGSEGQNEGKGKYLADSTDQSRVPVMNMRFLTFLLHFSGHTTLSGGLAFPTFQLS